MRPAVPQTPRGPQRYNDPWDVTDTRRPAGSTKSRVRPVARRVDPATYEGPAPESRIDQLKNYGEWAGIIGVAVVVALLVKVFVMQAFYIPSESMFPLLTEGDRVLVNKVTYKIGDIHRGDVIVFERPPGEDDTSISHLIKRVIGLPGDSVETKDGILFVNGVPQEESYVREDAATDGVPLTTVPPGMLWVMGDNRQLSADSRYFGAIDEDLVVGRADVTLWPLSKIKFL